MSTYDVCRINTTELDPDTKLPMVTASVPITGPDDVETFGAVANYQALGITVNPFPPSDDGAAEGVILRDVGNLNGAIVGMRDARCSSVVASLAPGDAVLHSCDPQAKAQVRVHANRQIAMVTEGTDGKTMLQLLDGKNDKITIAAFGGIIEMTPNGISLVAPGGNASILMEGKQITLLGNVQIGKNVPDSVVLCAPMATAAATIAALFAFTGGSAIVTPAGGVTASQL